MLQVQRLEEEESNRIWRIYSHCFWIWTTVKNEFRESAIAWLQQKHFQALSADTSRCYEIAASLPIDFSFSNTCVANIVEQILEFLSNA
jgi:hypothetical protein